MPIQQASLRKGLVGWWPLRGNAKDVTPHENNGTVTGGSWTTDRLGRASGAFNAGRINCGASGLFEFAATNPFTVSVWVYYDDTVSTSFPRIIERSNYTGNRTGWTVGVAKSSSLIFFERHYGNNTSSSRTAAITPFTWTHVVARFTGDAMRLYINGVPGASGGALSSMATYTADTFIGASSAAGSVWKGRIGDARIYDRALSDAEISALYASYNPGQARSSLQKGLALWWPTRGNARDVTPHGRDGTVSGASLTTDRLGRSNRAYAFRGSGFTDSISRSDLAGLFSGVQPVSMGCWVRHNGYVGQGSIFNTVLGWGNAGASSGATGFAIHVTSSGFSVQRSDGSGASDSTSQGVAYTGVWFHVLTTYDGSTIRLYLNGAPVGTPGASTRTLSGTAQNFNVGRDVGTTRYSSASISGIRLWSRALTAAEAASLYAGVS